MSNARLHATNTLPQSAPSQPAQSSATIPAVTLAIALVLMMPLTAHAQSARFQSSQTPTEATLYTFSGQNDGGNPWGGLGTFDDNLYGTTALGGASGCGVVFQMQLASGKWKESVIHTFANDLSDGCMPIGNVAVDAAGNIYGSTQSGGPNGVGTVWRLSPNGNGTWTEDVLDSFPANFIDGNTPFSGVILDSAGNIYGTTIYGGGRGKSNGCLDQYGCGTIFKLTPNGSSWTETVLYRFTGAADGSYPNGLTLDSQGRLYGTTGGGGTSGYAGTVFRLVPSGTSWKIQTLYEFTGQNDGAYPAGAVALDSSGNVYGTAYGGLFGAGVIFEIVNPGNGNDTYTGWPDKTLYSFLGENDGAGPEGGVVFDSAGNLYGTTQGVEAYNNALGSVFELQHSDGNWNMIPLYDFTGYKDGDTPFAGVTIDPTGRLYGTSSGVQGSGNGAVYAIKP